MNLPTATLFAAIASMVSAPVLAKPVVGQPAPEFTATDASGKTHSLSDFKGKTVVLEWHNPECPFVKKHYNGKNMQTQQAEAADAGVVWLSINSGAPGKQGQMDGAAATAYLAKAGAKPAAYLIDTEGKVGQAYGAKTTPHMFVIGPDGVLQYMGGIDSTPSTDPEDIPASTQYVRQALSELAAGKPVSVPSAEPYGCSVKYAG